MKRRTFFYLLFSASAITSSFFYGVAVGRYALFPFNHIKELFHKFVKGYDYRKYPHIYSEKINYYSDQFINIYLINANLKNIKSLKIYSAVSGELLEEKIINHKEFIQVDESFSIDYEGNKVKTLHRIKIKIKSLGALFLTVNKQTDLAFLRNNRPDSLFIINKVKDFKNFKVGLIYPEFTWKAYNPYGGISLYSQPFPIDKDMSSRECSKMRPNLLLSEDHSPFPTSIFSKLLSENDIEHISLTSSDLHENEDWMNLDLLILTGHDEYWSQNIRNNVTRFLNKGGNLAVFSGNTSFRTFEINGNNYKRTNHWDFIKPVEEIIGLTTRYGGFPARQESKPFFENSEFFSIKDFNNRKGMKILDSSHFIFRDTGLKDGDYLGLESELVCYEIDGAPLDPVTHNLNYKIKPKAKPIYSNEDFNSVQNKFPLKMKPLASSFLNFFGVDDPIYVASLIEAVVGKGKVINGGSVGWYRSIDKNDQIVKQVFINTIKYLS